MTERHEQPAQPPGHPTQTSRARRPLAGMQALLLGALGVVSLAGAGALDFPGAAACAAEGDPADAPLPEITAATLAEKIQSAWKGYSAGSLEIAFDEEQDRRGGAEDKAGERQATAKFPGRFQRVSDGRRWRIDFDSMMQSSGPAGLRLRPDRWSSGFDGGRHFDWDRHENEITFGRSEIRSWRLTPRDLFWPEGNDLLDLLRTPGTTVGQTTSSGEHCYLVEQVTGDWRTVYLVSPRQGYLGVETTRYHSGHPVVTHRQSELHLSDQGVWLPRQITYEWLNPKKDGTSHLELRRVMRLVRFDTSRTFIGEDFAPKVPFNADVSDLTLGTLYRNDPWWPEVGTLLRERFDWPKPDLRPLKDLQSYSDEAMDGKEAPPLQASLWINAEPIDWLKLRGKVVLLHFTALAGRHDEVPGLRRLAEHYKPAGLEVISVLGSYDDPDTVRQFVRELKIAHPVAIDRPGDRAYGATREAFAMSAEESTFLVDHASKLHRIERGESIDSLLQLLREAGARDVAPLSLETARFTKAMRTSVTRSWQEWIEQAPADGKIVGTINDAKGRPIAGAQIRATGSLRILTNPGGVFLFSAHAGHSAVSGADGRFVVSGLCKGNYTLRTSSPGLAPVDREALVGPDLAEVRMELALAQGDTISGLVRDESGQPLVAADVKISQHQLSHPDGTRTYFNGFLEMKITDRDGRFRFHRLEEGDYTLSIAAADFVPQTREHVPAGTTDLEVTLRRSGPR